MVLTYSTQKLCGLCLFLRLTETQTAGPSDCIEGEKMSDLSFRIHSFTCTVNPQETHPETVSGNVPCQNLCRTALISFHQGNTCSGNSEVQNVPLQVVLLDGSKVSSCSVYFGISVTSLGLSSTFLNLPYVFVGSLPSILPC